MMTDHNLKNNQEGHPFYTVTGCLWRSYLVVSAAVFAVAAAYKSRV